MSGPKELADKLAGRAVVLSMSGGKDSTAAAIHLREIGIGFRAVFMDTGWEHPATYAYINDVLDPQFGPIERLRSPKGGMADIIRHKAMFPSRLRRYCTQLLKFYPIRDFIRSLDVEAVNALGIRAGESRARSALEEWEWSKDLDAEVWRPIIDWSEDDVIAAHHRAAIEPNPLYLQGARRVGCFPCIFASKDEVRLVADLWPDRIGEIRQLEQELTDAAAERGADNPLRTYFHGRRGVDSFRIDEVVDWSRTARGGHQYMLIDSAAEQGCMRWGLCEHPSADRALVEVTEPPARSRRAAR